MAHEVELHAQAEASTRLNPFRLVHIPAAVGEIVEAIRDEMRGPAPRTDLVEPDAE